MVSCYRFYRIYNQKRRDLDICHFRLSQQLNGIRIRLQFGCFQFNAEQISGEKDVNAIFLLVTSGSNRPETSKIV